MENVLDQRESRVMDFINARNKEVSNQQANDAMNASTDLKFRQLGKTCDEGKSVCIDHLLGKLYKDALPFNDPKKNCTDAEARDIVHDYISRRTGGHDSEYYVKEALKKTNSSTLKNLLTEAENITKTYYREAAADIGKIALSDLNFNMNASSEDIDKITKKLNFDEISNIIQNNVQKAINDETTKSNNEQQYNQGIEDNLTNDMNVTDDASLESAMEKLNIVKQPTIYQPSLFEGIMLGKANVMTESTGEDIFHEAVHEYTLLNMSKALKLEKFTLDGIRSLANKYAGQ